MTRPAVQPAMFCPHCGGFDLTGVSRSDGIRDSTARRPGQRCAGCGAWWPIAVGQ